MYYLKRHNSNYQNFSIEQCKNYDSNAPLDTHIVRAQEVAEHEHITCEVVNECGNTVFTAFC